MAFLIRRGSKKYPYITARVRAMKSKLLPREVYPKLMNMDIPEITRLIGESEYKQDVDELAQKYSGLDLLEHALNQNLARTYRKLLRVSQDEPNYLITEYLRHWDIWNIKTILRGKNYGAPAQEILDAVVAAGQLGYRELTSIANMESIDDIKTALGNTPYYAAIANYDGGELSAIENELDKIYYSRLLASIGKSKGEKLSLKYIKTEIDLKNIKTLFRTKKAGLVKDDIFELLIPGGMELKSGDLKRMSSLPWSDFLKGLEDYSYWSEISEVVSEDMTSLMDVEALLDKYAMGYASRISHYYPLSILPIYDYMLRKNNEINNIRTIVRGKKVKLPDEIIRKHLVM
ncbi:MAG: V-type ATP synthase subunit C [Candidatus Methanocomedens sp.]|nr:MAG: V-type ATP synthase subunit C [ANME-2 cluster archaeon]